MHKATDAAHAHQRSDEQHHAKWHQDGSLQKIGDDNRPETANDAIEHNDRARTDHSPKHWQAAC